MVPLLWYSGKQTCGCQGLDGRQGVGKRHREIVLDDGTHPHLDGNGGYVRVGICQNSQN